MAVRILPDAAIPPGANLKMVSVIPTAPAGGPVEKQVVQLDGGFVPGQGPVYRLAPAGYPGSKTLFIPGFTGPA